MVYIILCFQTFLVSLCEPQRTAYANKWRNSFHLLGAPGLYTRASSRLGDPRNDVAAHKAVKFREMLCRKDILLLFSITQRFQRVMVSESMFLFIGVRGGGAGGGGRPPNFS